MAVLKYTHYFIFICNRLLGSDPHQQPDRIAHRMMIRNDKFGRQVNEIKWQGHKYAVIRNRAIHLQGFLVWLGWIRFNWRRPIRSTREWLKSKKIGMLIFQEPDDPLHGVEKAIKPLHISEICEDVGNTTPIKLKTVIDNQSYHKHIRALKFTKFGALKSRWLLIAIIAVIIIIALYLYFNGYLVAG